MGDLSFHFKIIVFLSYNTAYSFKNFPTEMQRQTGRESTMQRC